MKALFILLFTILVGNTCKSQNYIVHTVRGTVTVNKLQEVKPGMTLQADDNVMVDKDSRIVILSEKEKRLYTINGPGHSSLKQLFGQKDNSFRIITDSYIAFLKTKLTKPDKVVDKNYMQSAASSYREEDSTFVDIIISNAECDSTKNE